MDEYLDVGQLGHGHVRAKLKTLGPADWFAILGHADDLKAAFGIESGPRGENFPRPDGVEFLDAVKQQNRDGLPLVGFDGPEAVTLVRRSNRLLAYSNSRSASRVSVDRPGS